MAEESNPRSAPAVKGAILSPASRRPGPGIGIKLGIGLMCLLLGGVAATICGRLLSNRRTQIRADQVSTPVQFEPDGAGRSLVVERSPLRSTRGMVRTKDPPFQTDGLATRPTPEEERENLMRLMEESGPAQPWGKEAERAFEETIARLPTSALDGVAWRATRCAAAGCSKDAVYDSLGAVMSLDKEMFGNFNIPITYWQGNRHRGSPVKLPDGRLLATWVLFKPGS
jgi:hypothetical protein